MLNNLAIPDYDESRDRAGEYLRQIVIMLNQFAVIPNPVNYTVLYDYLTGRSADLVAEIEHARQNGGVNEALTRNLFKRYILHQQQDVDFERLQAEIKRIVEEILVMLAENAHKADESSSKLESFTKQLASEQDIEAIRRKVTEIVAETRLFGKLENNFSSAMQNTSRDINALQKELIRARKEAARDALTGILNRGAFDQALKETVAVQSTASLILLDVDHFKQINDSYGHLIGDKVIQYVASTLSKNYKGQDTVARFGGDEFTVILPDTPPEIARNLAEKVRIKVEQSRLKRTDNGQPLGAITLSTGVAGLHAGDMPETLMDRADKALYAAKEAGRNCVRVNP